jgi:hypothetical protein
MRRSRPSLLAPLAYVALVPLLASPACSDDVPTMAHIAPDAGADGHAASDGATPPDGARGSGVGGSGAVDAAASGGATDAHAGKANGGAASGGKGPVSGGTGGSSSGGSSGTCEIAGSQDGSAPEPLAICARLQGASPRAFDVTRAYDHAVYADCRVSWVSDLYLEVDKRPDFLNTLLAWTMKLWGCAAPAPDDFALIFERVPLTAGDAAALIDHYVEVATVSLELSPAEITEMRATLGYLARPLIADSSCELSKSRCIVDAGAGGSAGAGGNAATGGSNSGGATDGGGTGGGGSDASNSADASLDASTGAEASTGGAPN